MSVGIAGYGVYIPKYRIKAEEIARVWGADAENIKKSLGIKEKAVAARDEDTITIAVEASKNALEMAKINPKDIRAIYVGSESHPYAVKPTAATLAEAIGATPELTAADYEFACKAGTAGLQNCIALVESNMIKYGLACGADTAQASPGDALEYTAACGGAAYIVGRKSDDTVAYFEGTFSYTTDTPDFWRREGQAYPRHGGRFTGGPAYFKHIVNAATGLMKKLGLSVNDFDYVVFHQPNAKFPLRAAKMLGIDAGKLKAGLLVSETGNFYSGSSLVGLAAILDVAEPNSRILCVSYGSGAGSDAFSIVVQDAIEEKRIERNVAYYLKRKVYIDYTTYLKLRRIVKGG